MSPFDPNYRSQLPPPSANERRAKATSEKQRLGRDKRNGFDRAPLHLASPLADAIKARQQEAADA
jgi:hypothetical protein